MWVYNCSAYANTNNYGFTTAYGTNTIQNSLSFQGKNSDSYKSKNVVTIDHNSWNKGGCSAADFQSLDTTHLLDPRKADGTLPDDVFMHLTEESTLIDAGIDVNLGYNGAAPDLGCFESPGEHHDPIPDDTIPDVQPEGTHAIAYVSIPNATEDKSLLASLRQNDSLWIVVTDATDPSIDYGYEVIVIGSKPNSAAAGLAALKGYNKPILLLKPFLLKNTVWNWGNAINTQDLSVAVSAPEHPLFRGLTLTENTLALFTQCTTNAVTAISEWYNTTDFDILASPVSQSTYTTIADFPAGSNCNGTILLQRLVMIGISEYSMANLTEQAKQLIENAILYLLGIDIPEGIEDILHETTSTRKYLHNGKLFIQVDEKVYNALGQCML